MGVNVGGGIFAYLWEAHQGVWVHVHVELENNLVSSAAFYHFLFLCLRQFVTGT